jgi:hypothetical protein
VSVYPRCARHPQAPRRGINPRCPNEATHIYTYLCMSLCTPCSVTLREAISLAGFDAVALVVPLAVYTGSLHDGTEYRDGVIVARGAEAP